MTGVGGVWVRPAGSERGLGGVYEPRFQPNPADKTAGQNLCNYLWRGVAGFEFKSYTYTRTHTRAHVRDRSSNPATPRKPRRPALTCNNTGGL